MPVRFRLGAASLALKNKQRKIQISPGILHWHSPTQDSSDNSILVLKILLKSSHPVKMGASPGELSNGKTLDSRFG